MQMYFVMQENVLNPENREVVLTKHATYSVADVESKRVEYGFDNFKATVIFAESWEHAVLLSA